MKDLNKKKTIFIWSPFTSKVGTTQNIINNSYSLIKYSPNLPPTISATSTSTVQNTSLFYFENEDTVTLTSSVSETSKWFKDGVEILGEISPSLVVTQTGDYKVQYYNQTGCYSLLSEEISITFYPLPTIEGLNNFSDNQVLQLTSTNTASSTLPWSISSSNASITTNGIVTAVVTGTNQYTSLVTFTDERSRTATKTIYYKSNPKIIYNGEYVDTVSTDYSEQNPVDVWKFVLEKI